MMDSQDLAGKVIVVTGGSRGIGRQIVLGAAQRGARVAFCARVIDHEARDLTAEAERFGGPQSVLAIRSNIAIEHDVEALFDTILRVFGRLDVAINNAGISRSHLLVTLPTSVWDEVMTTNLTGAFLVAKRAVQVFLERGSGGRIISLGSVMQNGAPSNASYAASKGGLVGLTRSIAQAYSRHGIYANLVVGGFTDTDLLRASSDAFLGRVVEQAPQRRLASANEIADVVLFLASNRARYIANGAAISASGGLLEAPQSN